MEPRTGTAGMAWLAGGAGLVAGFAAGFAMRGGTATATATATIEADAACTDEIRERDEEREIRLLLERELYGEKIPWPAGMPPERTEAEYRTALGEIVKTCQPGWIVGELDCAEPPCIAAIWSGDEPAEVPANCVAWTSRYGAGAQIATQLVDCDGVERRLMLLSPVRVDTTTPSLELENRAKRLKTRWGELRHDARCPTTVD